ncbi:MULTISPECIES: DNA adenine methylase [Flavobacteriaceae]|uniref:site-specific DNA-methyltransferase (adenine-specific) n=2 Tax=Flavobacteriaceae TaxID=49546 RepID=A0A4Y8ASA4_9FLAO|nr:MULTISPECIES: DNA adenine methylase [Flavobacteriaceae]TEW74073.1 modification methylase [Gramella jeungdoensis]GGK40023.1 restriction endonuclease subunit M [Lutibacter litoralis]
MNYIGSKHKLASFLKTAITQVVGDNLEQLVFCDLFAGTGIVGRNFKPFVKQVIANDVEFYSYVLNRNYIGNFKKLDIKNQIDFLNNLEGVEGFIFQNYCENGSEGRLYFSSENGKKIDAMRQQIEVWKSTNKINEDTYFFLLASLIESADRVANTASVYGAYLKKIKKSAQNELVIQPANFELTKNAHKVFNQDGNVLIKKIKGDILYLDPPYNARQYGSNYHLLTTIAKYDTFEPQGKTGLRSYYRSSYCKKNEVKKYFVELIKNANFKYIFLSYNNEGLMTEDEIRSVMSAHGKYSLKTTNYQRFKADKTENRNHKATETVEYLHILEKQL